MYYDIGAYDMLYSEFNETCHKAWSERLDELYFDKAKNKNEGKNRILNESKYTYAQSENEPF